VVIVALVMATRGRRGPRGGGQEPAAPAQPPSEFCANCGNPIAPTTRFCPKCGAQHSEPDPGSSQGPVQ
jgi:hypothetical protein